MHFDRHMRGRIGKLDSIVVTSTVGNSIDVNLALHRSCARKKGFKSRFRRQSVLLDLRQNLFHLRPVEGTHGMALDVAE
jgi:hypothetical protein